MQHNAIHGAEKQGFTKSQDIPNANATPRPAATGRLASIALESDASPSDSAIPTSNSTDIDLTQLEEGNLSTNHDDIIETEHFDVPFLSTVNMATSFQSSPFTDVTPGELITDHLQYLSYQS